MAFHFVKVSGDLMCLGKYFGEIAIIGFLILANGEALSAGESGGNITNTSTQGQFAVSLAESLGHPQLKEEEAIKLLSNLSISPSVTPTQSKWQKDQVATPQFVSHIQASIQLVLKKVAEKSQIQPPPTLDLMIFELPPAPQRVFFSAENNVSTPTSVIESNIPPPITPIPIPPSNELMQDVPNDANTIGGGTAYDAEDTVKTEAPANLTGSIDQAVLTKLNNQDKVAVIVELKPVTAASPDTKVEDIIAKEQKAVLDTLSAEEFKLKHLYQNTFIFSGWVSREGVKKLEKNSAVLRVSLDDVSSVQN